MSWLSSRLEPTATHLIYLLLSLFLIIYALLSSPIRNTIHLSEPPLATLLGIILGPRALDVLNPTRWGIEDNVTQETTRVIVGLQVFSVGVELPKKYFSRKAHLRSVAMLLGPVMTFSWLITAAFTVAVLHTPWTTALIISACLAPTDPVLAASVLAESRFAHRVPARLRHMLSAESGCNDGVSFPFLYIGLLFTTKATVGAALKEWVLGTMLWQCTLGLLLGLLIGKGFNIALRLSERKNTISPPAFLVFYFLLAIFAVGVGSTLGVDDFLVAFGAGYGFAYDGWFARKTRATHLPQVLDLLLNSAMFIYFGTIIPWHLIAPSSSSSSSVLTTTTTTTTLLTSSPPPPSLILPSPSSASTATVLTPWRLLALLLLILLFRRIPALLTLHTLRWIPDIRTYREALFTGHFGPMGLGALFLAIEARAVLETGSALPLPHPDRGRVPHYDAVETVWPVVAFVILGSVMVHGLSVAVICVGGHYSRRRGERAALLGQESEGLGGMVHCGGGGESASSCSDSSDDGSNGSDGGGRGRPRGTDGEAG